jgi:hypothetical protein
MASNGAGDDTRPRAEALVEFNAVLDRKSRPENLHEGFLERKLQELDGLDVGRGAPYWLTLARITELTLLCAGRYADNGELAAAGDLLVNPRLIVIHVRGVSEPLVKDRRGGMTDKLGHLLPTADGVIGWLKENTWVEIRKEPLLPHLYRRLEQSGFLARSYLESVDRRMKRVAEVLAFLGSWHLPEGCDPQARLREAPCRDQEFINSQLCRFDRESFVELGLEFRQCGKKGPLSGRFLSTGQGAGVLPTDGGRSFDWPMSLRVHRQQ